MNNTIKLAVASALLAAASSASAAGGIVAGDWTLDIGGIVNAYYTSTKTSGAAGGGGYGSLFTNNDSLTGGSLDNRQSNITTGLLPNYLAVSGKTRQNDLDVAFTISINPGASTTQAGIQNGTTARGGQENRQAFLTFGDASWGSVKLGKDLGIYASDAILNDMTLLGVGSGATLAGNTTTTGRIGTGFMYADWKSQVAYSSPNFGGFSFTGGVTQAFNAINAMGDIESATNSSRGGSQPAFEAKASYAFSADAVNGKVWVSGISQKMKGLGDDEVSATARSGDIGANLNAAGFGLTAYYYEGKGIGQTVQFADGFDEAGNKRKSDGYYVQGTFTVPGAGTKLGASWGESQLKGTADDADLASNKDQMWTIGAYHPLTKHLNLVAEYSEVESKFRNADDDNLNGKAKTIALGAILFF
jgi:predicted porin